MWTCSTCGEVHEDQFTSCWTCTPQAAAPEAAATSVSAGQVSATLARAASQGQVTVADFGPPTKARYAEAYLTAHSISAVGKAIKVIGGIVFALGILGIMAALGESNEYGSSSGGIEALFSALLALIGGLIAVMGIMVSSQAQLNLSSLDCAVHTSPFLTETQRAETMRLRMR